MALVNHGEEILGEKIQQAVGAGAGGAAVKVPGVVLYAAAVAQFAYHLNVIFHTLLQALGLKRLAYLLEVLHALHKVILDGTYGPFLTLFGSHEEISRIDAVELIRVNPLTGKHIELLDGINLIVPELDAYCRVVVGQVYIDVLALDAETAACQLNVVAGI